MSSNRNAPKDDSLEMIKRNKQARKGSFVFSYKDHLLHRLQVKISTCILNTNTVTLQPCPCAFYNVTYNWFTVRMQQKPAISADWIVHQYPSIQAFFLKKILFFKATAMPGVQKKEQKTAGVGWGGDFYKRFHHSNRESKPCTSTGLPQMLLCQLRTEAHLYLVQSALDGMAVAGNVRAGREFFTHTVQPLHTAVVAVTVFLVLCHKLLILLHSILDKKGEKKHHMLTLSSSKHTTFWASICEAVFRSCSGTFKKKGELLKSLKQIKQNMLKLWKAERFKMRTLKLFCECSEQLNKHQLPAHNTEYVNKVVCTLRRPVMVDRA